MLSIESFVSKRVKVFMFICLNNFFNQNTGSTIRGSSPNESSDKSIALPAAASWYMDVYVCTRFKVLNFI